MDVDPADLPAPPWRRPTGRPPRQQLTTDAVVEAALRVMDAEGLDAVSMRRVAQELDTGAASLYQHVRNKRDLHELMLDRAFADIRVPEPDPERWQQQLKEVLGEMSRMLRQRRGIARIAMETLIPTTPGLLVEMDALLGLLRSAGIPDRLVSPVSDILALYVTAHAYEASLWPTEEDGVAEASRRIEEIQQYLASLPADRLPHMAALQSQFDHADVDTFELALDIFIAGLAAYATGGPRQAS